MEEIFIYDALGRMTSKQAVTTANGTPQATTTFSLPSFDATKVHAMAQAQTADGVFPASAQSITYTGFDKVRTLKQGNDSIRFTYGFDRQRIRMEETVGGKIRTKDYVGSCEFVTESDSLGAVSRSLAFISGPYGTFAVAENSDSVETLHFILKDNLGSWTTITDETGHVEQRLSFDAWGNPRDPNTWSGNFTGTPLFDRGFTGHEHLYEFGLINMNGRMYDPVMSSFLSVDQYVQSPENAQSFNRYAYCSNNRLKYVDPSGWLQVGGQWGYSSNPSANDPYAYVENRPLEPRDLGLRQLPQSELDVVWMEGSDLRGGGGGGGIIGGGFYVNLASGLIEHHDGQTNYDYLKQGLVFLANDNASINDIETALEQKGMTYEKDPNVLGGYIVDTQKAYQGWQLWKSMPLFAAIFSGMITEEALAFLSLIPVNNIKYTVDPKKYDFFFGKVSSSPHNATRSIQNAKALETLGITNKAQLNSIFEHAIIEGEIVSTKTGSFGTTIVRRVEIGQNGCIDVGFFYQSNSILNTPKVTSIIPKIYKP